MRIGAAISAPPAAAPAEDAAQLRAAASAFETMMLKEILRTAVPGTGDAREGLALEAVAGQLAPSISFGLAQLLEKQP